MKRKRCEISNGSSICDLLGIHSGIFIDAKPQKKSPGEQMGRLEFLVGGELQLDVGGESCFNIG